MELNERDKRERSGAALRAMFDADRPTLVKPDNAAQLRWNTVRFAVCPQCGARVFAIEDRALCAPCASKNLRRSGLSLEINFKELFR